MDTFESSTAAPGRHPAEDRATRRDFAVGAAAALAGAAVATLASSASAQLHGSAQTASIQPGGLLILDTIQVLQSMKVGQKRRAALVLGHSTPNDGGGGLFFWDSVSAEPEDGGTFFPSFTSMTGRWIRLVI